MKEKNEKSGVGVTAEEARSVFAKMFRESVEHLSVPLLLWNVELVYRSLMDEFVAGCPLILESKEHKFLVDRGWIGVHRLPSGSVWWVREEIEDFLKTVMYLSVGAFDMTPTNLSNLIHDHSDDCDCGCNECGCHD